MIGAASGMGSLVVINVTNGQGGTVFMVPFILNEKIPRQE